MPGILARIVKVAPVRQGGARGHEAGQHAEEQKLFHAGIEPERLARVNAGEKPIAQRPASREISAPSGAMD